MEFVMDFDYLRGRQNEIIVNEAAVAGENVSALFRLEPPYYMAHHGAVENGLNWYDGNDAYHKLSAVLKEAVAGFAHVYSFDPTKCRFLSALLDLTVLELETFKCPPAKKLKPRY